MSDAFLRASGSPTRDVFFATADQDTIVGDGSTENPLRAGSGALGGTIQAGYVSVAVPTPLPGQPTRIRASVNGLPGLTVVDPRARDNPAHTAEFLASVAGVIAQVNDDGTVQFQTSGVLTLTTAAWDALTGDVGGLVRGDAYYASATTLGEITNDVPVGPGQFVSRIGFAISATAMLIQPDAPVQNLGDLLAFVTFVASPLIIGSAVAVETTGAGRRIKGAISDGTLAEAQAIGVVAAFDTNGDPIVQTGGVVVLTTAQWDAVTNTSPGMQAGTAYYADTTANAGHLTATAPLSGFQTQIGVGLSTTRMILPAPFPLRF